MIWCGLQFMIRGIFLGVGLGTVGVGAFVLALAAFAIEFFGAQQRPRPALPELAAHPCISVVLPAFNEAGAIKQVIEDAINKAQLPQNIQLIVVDANSTDATAAIAASAVKWLTGRIKSFAVVTSMSGRAMALNAGAGLASGDILLFLHADTRLPQGWDAAIIHALQDRSVVAGAFSFAIDRSTISPGVELEGISVLEFFTNFRAHALWLPYGDQTLFMTKARWMLHGPFEWLPMMEDYVFMRKLRKIALSERCLDGRDDNSLPLRPAADTSTSQMVLRLSSAIAYMRRLALSLGLPKTSKIVILSEAALCGARRWEKNGILTNTMLNQAFVFAYTWLRVPAPRIFEWYYGRKWSPSSVLQHPADPSVEQTSLAEGVLAIRAFSSAER